MTVLITGSAGLVGHAVRRRLEADGVPVLPVDRDARSFDGVDQVPCDVTDRAAVDALFGRNQVAAVVHCGGVSGPMVSPDAPRAIVEVNVGGTANLLDAARRHRVSRFVHCSSIAAYGQTPPGPVAESAVVAALRASAVGDAYNVTGGTLLTVEEVIEIVRRVDPRVEVEQTAADPAGAARWPSRLDIGAAARDLGYRPDDDLEAAVAGYRSWLDRNPVP